MINFNMENAKLPLYYQKFMDNKLDYIQAYYIKNGWTTDNFNSSVTLPNLKIGGKYYALVEHNLMAFKVKSFTVTSGLYINIEIVFANGENIALFSDSTFFDSIFKTIEDYKRFKETHDPRCYFKERINKVDIFQEYINNGVLYESICPGNKSSVNIPIYELNRYNQPELTRAFYKFLWIDEDGLHFSIYDENNSTKYYLSEEECRNSSKIIDFDDEEYTNDVTITLTISINGSKVKDAVKTISSLGGFVK